MHMLLAFLITAAVLGVVITYVQPAITNLVPAALTANPYVSIAVVGALALVSLLIASFLLRTFKLPRAV